MIFVLQEGNIGSDFGDRQNRVELCIEKGEQSWEIKIESFYWIYWLEEKGFVFGQDDSVFEGFENGVYYLHKLC